MDRIKTHCVGEDSGWGLMVCVSTMKLAQYINTCPVFGCANLRFVLLEILFNVF